MAELIQLSHSRAHTYNECPYRLKLEKIDRVEQVPWLAGPAGTAFHHMSEEVDSGPCHDVELPWTSYKDWLIDAIEKDTGKPFEKMDLLRYRLSRKENFDWWVTEGEQMIKRYYEWRLTSGWKIWTSDFEPEWDLEGNIANGYLRGVETSFRVDLPGMEVPDVGYIDRIFVLPDGRVILIDLKTWFRERTTTQLQHYMVIAREHLGIPVDGIGYYDARLGKPTGLSYPKDWDTKRLVELLKPVEEGIIGDVFPPKPGAQCGWCSVAKHCEFREKKK